MLAALALSMMLSSLGASSANVALPTFATVFGASVQQVQWVVLADLLAITSVCISVGRQGDFAGRGQVLLAGIGLFTVASALCALAPSLPLLVAARLVQGFGAAPMMSLAMASVAEVAPKAGQGKALGVLATMSAVGTALGPALGGALVTWLKWPAIFGVNVPLGIAAYFLAHRFLAPDCKKVQTEPRFDHAGTVLLAFTLTAYALAMTLGSGSFGR